MYIEIISQFGWDYFYNQSTIELGILYIYLILK